MSTITIQDVGPVEALSIPVQPGVVVLRGPNDSGKSLSIEAASKLAGGNSTVTRRDKATSGSIEGLGVKISVRQSARRSGELEALSIEGKLSIADLVDPKIKDPVAADRQRIKAILQLTGVKADVKLFENLLPGNSLPEKLSVATIKTDDLVELAAGVKRDLEAASRKEASEAEKAETLALSYRQAAEGVDMGVETDGVVLQGVLEDALHVHSTILANEQSAKESKAAGEQAKAKLREFAARQRPALGEVTAKQAECTGEVAFRDNEVESASTEVTRAETDLAKTKSRLDRAKQKKEVAAILLTAANGAVNHRQHEDDLLHDWKGEVDIANAVVVPSPEQVAEAEQPVTQAREAIEQAAVVREAKKKAVEAESLRVLAKTHNRAAESLREAARATDDVLSEAVASESLTVKGGRLVTQHPDRGEVYYGDRSDGTRWKLAIDEAIKRIRQLGAEQTALIPVPQAAWSELDPTNKTAVHEYAVAKGVTILTAEATDGCLRAEIFGGEV